MAVAARTAGTAAGRSTFDAAASSAGTMAAGSASAVVPHGQSAQCEARCAPTGACGVPSAPAAVRVVQTSPISAGGAAYAASGATSRSASATNPIQTASRCFTTASVEAARAREGSLSCDQRDAAVVLRGRSRADQPSQASQSRLDLATLRFDRVEQLRGCPVVGDPPFAGIDGLQVVHRVLDALRLRRRFTPAPAPMSLARVSASL